MSERTRASFIAGCAKRSGYWRAPIASAPLPRIDRICDLDKDGGVAAKRSHGRAEPHDVLIDPPASTREPPNRAPIVHLPGGGQTDTRARGSCPPHSTPLFF